VAGKKRKARVGKDRLNASQILAMGRAPIANPAVPLFTNNALGEEQLMKAPVKKMSVETISTQTEKDIEQVKPIFKRINASVEVPKNPIGLLPIPTTIPSRSRNQITPSMVSQASKYNPILGENIPIKREGQYVVKETGLFAPDTRGAPVKEDTIAKSYGDIGRYFTRP